MSVTIRLARIGRKNLPAYKMVVSNTRGKRNGKYVDILGHYNPSSNPVSFDYDKVKMEEWKSKGALITQSVQKLLDGNYSYVVYDPKGKKAKAASKNTQEVKQVSEVPETPETTKESETTETNEETIEENTKDLNTPSE